MGGELAVLERVDVAEPHRGKVLRDQAAARGDRNVIGPVWVARCKVAAVGTKRTEGQITAFREAAQYNDEYGCRSTPCAINSYIAVPH
jgi:hypothetical protein